MDPLSPQGVKIVEYLGQKYGVSTEAVTTLLDALLRGNGESAQFSHPDLGGAGQWSRSGITTGGEALNGTLKARVEGLCAELAELAKREISDAAGASGEFSLFVSSASCSGGAWWDAGLGVPSSSGCQKNLSYAWFRATRRLAIRIGGRVFLYDTGDYEISGMAPQQGGDTSLTFISQHGPVRLAELRGVSTGENNERARDILIGRRTPIFGSETQADDIFTKLERLAELRRKGVISEDDFAAKKSELLERL